MVLIKTKILPLLQHIHRMLDDRRRLHHPFSPCHPAPFQVFHKPYVDPENRTTPLANSMQSFHYLDSATWGNLRLQTTFAHRTAYLGAFYFTCPHTHLFFALLTLVQWLSDNNIVHIAANLEFRMLVLSHTMLDSHAYLHLISWSADWNNIDTIRTH